MDDEINELMILADRARAGANTTYSQACIYLIFLMQAAFTLYELAGTRHKNYVFLLIKNLVIISVGSLVWWLVGFAFYWGNSAGGGIGSSYFAEDSLDYNITQSIYSLKAIDNVKCFAIPVCNLIEVIGDMIYKIRFEKAIKSKLLYIF